MQTNSLTLDFYQLFEKVASDCDLDKSTIQYCLRRLRAEGLKFWTITLPKLAKCVLYSIEFGKFQHRTGDSVEDRLTCFAWKGRSLRYFRSLLGQIFSLETGDLLSDPSATALRSLRQICEYVYKLNLAFEDADKVKSEQKYETVQAKVASARFSRQWLEALRRNAETHYPRFAAAELHDILEYGPRFGPGSFELTGEQRSLANSLGTPFYVWRTMPDNVIGTCDRKFRGSSGYFKPYKGSRVPIKLVTEGRTAKVLFVPKDSRGPRVISKEPLHIIKPQMAFLSHAVDALERDSLQRINFRSQDTNRDLAKEGSVSKKIGTFDLKDASDMVAVTLVRYISRNMPGVRWFLQNSRSTHYRLPSGKVGPQSAVAGMGSGLTFPLLALVIHLSVCTHISSMCRLPYQEVSRCVYVYGDDLIVPIKWSHYVQEALEKSGLVLNKAKCYVKGPFRESCGGDYLAGIECSPIRLKLQNCSLPASLGGRSLVLRAVDCVDDRGRIRGDNLVLSLDRHAKELRKAGWFNTASFIEDTLEKVVPMPYVGEGSPVIGRYTDDEALVTLQGGPVKVTFSQDICSNFVRAASPRTVDEKPVDRVTDSPLGCPYKYLASFFKGSAGRTVTYDLGKSSGQAFGVVSEPRISVLTYRKRPVSDLARVVDHEFVRSQIDLRSKAAFFAGQYFGS